jgi:hypothetical protein
MLFPNRMRLKSTGLAVWLGIAALGAWLLHPALTPVHVEGFSASIVAIGLHLAHGTVGDFLPFEGFGTDYFGLTKFGAVAWVALLSPVLGGNGAMRLLMLVGLLLTWASTAYLIRTWTGARWWIIAIVLLLMPGLAEAAFFFNDNLPAAGLLLAGFCILVRWPTAWPAAVVAGLSIGCAITVRFDLVLVAVSAVPLILWPRGGRTLVMMTGVAGASAVVVVYAVLAASGATPFDVLRVGSYAVALWDRPLDIARHAREFFFFIGLPNAVLMVPGIRQLVRQRSWHRLALFCGVPLLFNLVLLGTLWQARQFLALAPFLGALAAHAAESTIASARTSRPGEPLLFAALVLVVLAGPVAGLKMSDGPHAFVGRLAGVTLWKDWQANVQRDFARIDAIIDGATAQGPLIVLTDGWDVDRYLHLQLVERGFRRAVLPAPCPMLGEAFTLGDRTIVQLSLRTTFVPYWSSLQAVRLQQGAIPCVSSFDAPELLLLTEDRHLRTLFPQADARAVFPEFQTGKFDVIPLDAESLAILGERYRRDAELNPPPASFQETQALLKSRTPFSR